MKTTAKPIQELQGGREKRERDLHERILAEMEASDQVIDLHVREISPGISYRINLIGFRPNEAEFLHILGRRIISSHYVTLRKGRLSFDPPLKG